MLIGLLATAGVGMTFGIVPRPSGILSAPPSLGPTFLKLDITGALAWNLTGVIFVLFFLDLFDTVGTLIAVGRQAGFMKEGRLPRERWALLSDAIATVAGALCGTSTVTSYIESSAGIAAGARTGLANVVTGLLFLGALFFAPIVQVVGGGVIHPATGQTLYPVTAPVLIVIGAIMLTHFKRITFEDLTEGIPAFLTLFLMPITFSITEGIAFGFISYAFLKLVSGKGRQVPALVHVFAVLFLLKYALALS